MRPLALLLMALAFLTACGVDGDPIPPEPLEEAEEA